MSKSTIYGSIRKITLKPQINRRISKISAPGSIYATDRLQNTSNNIHPRLFDKNSLKSQKDFSLEVVTDLPQNQKDESAYATIDFMKETEDDIHGVIKESVDIGTSPGIGLLEGRKRRHSINSIISTDRFDTTQTSSVTSSTPLLNKKSIHMDKFPEASTPKEMTSPIQCQNIYESVAVEFNANTHTITQSTNNTNPISPISKSVSVDISSMSSYGLNSKTERLTKHSGQTNNTRHSFQHNTPDDSTEKSPENKNLLRLKSIARRNSFNNFLKVSKSSVEQYNPNITSKDETSPSGKSSTKSSISAKTDNAVFSKVGIKLRSTTSKFNRANRESTKTCLTTVTRCKSIGKSTTTNSICGVSQGRFNSTSTEEDTGPALAAPRGPCKFCEI